MSGLGFFQEGEDSLVGGVKGYGEVQEAKLANAWIL